MNTQFLVIGGANGEIQMVLNPAEIVLIDWKTGKVHFTNPELHMMLDEDKRFLIFNALRRRGWINSADLP